MFLSPESINKYIKETDNVIDVGGGKNPFLRADTVIDVLPHFAYNKFWDEKKKEKKFDWYQGDICLPKVWENFKDKQFDFAICSHTLEDVVNPVFVCEQLSRIAKAGYIEFPSKWMETVKLSDAECNGSWHHRFILEVCSASDLTNERLVSPFWKEKTDPLNVSENDLMIVMTTKWPCLAMENFTFFQIALRIYKPHWAFTGIFWMDKIHCFLKYKDWACEESDEMRTFHKEFKGYNTPIRFQNRFVEKYGLLEHISLSQPNVLQYATIKIENK